MDVKSFVGHCIKDMVSSGVTIEFTKRKNVSRSAYSYFSETNGTVPNFRLNYFEDDLDIYATTILHEYCHFLQWKEGWPLFFESDNAYDRFHSWLDKESKRFFKKDLKTIQKVELDCGKRMSKVAKQLKLKIDPVYIIQESNSYILSYNYVYEKRYFFESSAYADDDLLALVPKRHLRETELDMIIPEHRRLFLERST